jgi:hypothetical protein
MIGYILIVLFTLINLGESVIVRTYGRKHGSGGLILSAITSLFALTIGTICDIIAGLILRRQVKE